MSGMAVDFLLLNSHQRFNNSDILFAIIDIETTGSVAAKDKITEVAVFLHDGLSVIDEYVSLVNPQRAIPFNIQRMTGITNEMVATAPRFYEIAKKIIEFTEGKIFVAHNSHFDYTFLRSEFKSLGYDFRRDTLCTCRLSRKLMPGYPSYSLGNLAQSLQIELHARHRAGGDAAATVKVFERILSLGKESEISQMIKPWNYFSDVPGKVPPDVIRNLPEETGIYYFLNEKMKLFTLEKAGIFVTGFHSTLKTNAALK